MVQFYKLIFNIKPPEKPEAWTDLERSRQQKLAALEPEIQATGGQHNTGHQQLHTTDRK